MHRLVVVDNEDKVIGMISLSDILSYLVLRHTTDATGNTYYFFNSPTLLMEFEFNSFEKMFKLLNFSQAKTNFIVSQDIGQFIAYKCLMQKCVKINLFIYILVIEIFKMCYHQKYICINISMSRNKWKIDLHNSVFTYNNKVK